MTRIAPIRYYQGRVAYPSREQMEQAQTAALLDFGEGDRPTEDVDCTHLQKIVVRGPSSQIRRLDDEAQQKFFDYIGYKQGFRVLTHESTTDSTRGQVTIRREIVYVIESRPTKGYVRLTLKSEQSPSQVANEGKFDDMFNPNLFGRP